MQQDYGNDCPSCAWVHEWYTVSKNQREDIKEDPEVGQA